jgi:chromosome partitioning protein
MVDRRKRIHRDLVEQLPAKRSEIVPVAVPAATEVEQMGVHRRSVVESAPTSRAAEAYRTLWDEVASVLGLERQGG